MKSTRILAATEIAATAFWIGACASFAFISAPLAFRSVKDRDVFSALSEQSLARLVVWANVSGGLAVAAAAAQRAPLRAGIGTVALSLLTYHQKAIVPAMSREQASLGSFNEVAPGDSRRSAYRSLHEKSRRIFGGGVLLGTLALVLAASSSRD